MLNFDRFDESPQLVTPGIRIAPYAALVWDAGADMRVTVLRHATRTGAPTLLVRGEDRAQEDWFALELDLPTAAARVALTVRNYPVHRLFPRLHYDRQGVTQHLDLPHVAASDAFATRYFEARQWAGALTPAPDAMRLTVLVPSTPWFAMEIAGLAIVAEAEAARA